MYRPETFFYVLYVKTIATIGSEPKTVQSSYSAGHKIPLLSLRGWNLVL